MKSDSNQLANLYGTVVTHKFENLKDITVTNLKSRPIIDQTGTFKYNAAKVNLGYLRPLCKNEYSVDDMQKLPNLLSSIPPLQKEKNVYVMMSGHCLHVFRQKKQLTTLLKKSPFNKSCHKFLQN